MAMKFCVFWNVTSCSQVKIYGFFRSKSSYIQRGRVGDSSVLRMVAVHSSETSVNLSQTTRRHIPEVGNLYKLKWVVVMYNGGCENLTFKGNHYCCITWNFLISGVAFSLQHLWISLNDQKLFVYTTGFAVRSPK